MKILLFSRYDRLGASSRVRFLQYIKYLEQHNIQVTVAPLLSDNYIKALYSNKPRNMGAIVLAYLQRMALLFKAHNYDLLWIEKELFPWLPAFAERLFTYLQVPYVVDYDDAVFHNYDASQNNLVRFFLGKKIDVVMRHAKLVIVGNDYLAERARQVTAQRVEYLPSVIDLDQYPLVSSPENLIPMIGWIGTPATAKYLSQIGPALAQVCQQKKARLVVVGLTSFELDGLPVELRAWSEQTEVADIQAFDIGIMPLPDDAWARGKCGYKLIQYMACGKPVIASPVGVNQQIVQQRQTGLLASTEAEWVAALSQLLDDKQLREKMGKAGRLRVEQEYCVQVTAPKLVALLTRVV